MADEKFKFYIQTKIVVRIFCLLVASTYGDGLLIFFVFSKYFKGRDENYILFYLCKSYYVGSLMCKKKKRPPE